MFDLAGRIYESVNSGARRGPFRRKNALLRMGKTLNTHATDRAKSAQVTIVTCAKRKSHNVNFRRAKRRLHPVESPIRCRRFGDSRCHGVIVPPFMALVLRQLLILGLIRSMVTRRVSEGEAAIRCIPRLRVGLLSQPPNPNS